MITLTNKKELRKQALKKRNLLAQQGVMKNTSLKIVHKILNSKIFQEAKHIALFYPFKNEIDLRNLLRVENKNFYLPKCNDLDMDFIEYKNEENLIENKWGIMEPQGEKINPEILDVIYIPALLANKNLYRIGYGKGFYDRFFKKHHLKAKKIIVISNNFVIDENFEETFDIQADEILSEI